MRLPENSYSADSGGRGKKATTPAALESESVYYDMVELTVSFDLSTEHHSIGVAFGRQPLVRYVSYNNY